MKIRNGFVSNSSSSSFIAWGVDKCLIEFGDESYLALFNERLNDLSERSNNPEDKWFQKHYVKEYEEMLRIRSEGNDSILEYSRKNMEPDYNLGDFESGGQEDDWVAIDISTIIKDHPEWTFGEIKSRVAELMNKTFGTNLSEKDIRFIEEAWYNG